MGWRLTTGRNAIRCELFTRQGAAVPEIPLSFRLAPTQTVLTVRSHAGTREPELVPMQWGLVPSWSPNTRIGPMLAKAPLEELHTRPSFSAALQRRRCIVFADGCFCETGTTVPATVATVHRQDEGSLLIAGLWDRWVRGEEVVESFAIIESAASHAVAGAYERLPVILSERDTEIWLDATITDVDVLMRLLARPPEVELTFSPMWVPAPGNPAVAASDGAAETG